MCNIVVREGRGQMHTGAGTASSLQACSGLCTVCDCYLGNSMHRLCCLTSQCDQPMSDATTALNHRVCKSFVEAEKEEDGQPPNI